MTYRRNNAGPVLRLRNRLGGRRGLGPAWIGIGICPKAVELVNIRLQQSMGDVFTTGWLRPGPASLVAPDNDASVPYRPNIYVLFGRYGTGATGAAASSRSASLKWTTSSPVAAVARTTARTCSWFAPTATGSASQNRASRTNGVGHRRVCGVRVIDVRTGP